MATYQVRLKVTSPFLGNPDWYCEAISKDGYRMAYAYGKSESEAVSKVSRQVREKYYNDVDIIY